MRSLNGFAPSPPVATAFRSAPAQKVPCAPVNDIESALNDPQVAHNQMVLDMRHPDLGAIRTVGIPVKLEGTPGAVHRPPPRLGEHTREVLQEFGLSKNEIDALASRRVIA